ncbi:hypothetical protein APHAL10511_005755 [Amanita phalloides]|nr:hypothetical protein APHAL10511_005755 [Amanita phalloides]
MITMTSRLVRLASNDILQLSAQPTVGKSTATNGMSNQLKTNNLPPLYKIDLSLPPHIRYAQLCADYKSELASLSSLYTEAVECLGASWLAKLLFTLGKKLFLRKLYSKEETEEIRAIAKAVGIEMYLAVAYNTFLDLFSGCTSAGIKLRGDTSGEDRIVHLRTLDWDMEPLRNLIVRIEYIRERKVVARPVFLSNSG